MHLASKPHMPVTRTRSFRTSRFARIRNHGRATVPADVGTDEATPVTEEYAEGDNAFTGTIEKITVDLT